MSELIYIIGILYVVSNIIGLHYAGDHFTDYLIDKKHGDKHIVNITFLDVFLCLSYIVIAIAWAIGTIVSKIFNISLYRSKK